MAQSTKNQKKTSQSRSSSAKSKGTRSKPSARTTTTRQARQTSRPVKRRKKRDPFADEIALITTAVISILLILSNLHLGGKLSDYINGIMFGLMGFFARFFPFVLFFGVAFAISNRGNSVAKRKLYSSIGFVFVFLGILQLIAYPELRIAELGRVYEACSSERLGGGLIGSLLSAPLVTLVGNIGAFVVLFALLAILFMFVTEIFLFSAIGKKGAECFHEMRERRYEEYEDYEDYEERSYGRESGRSMEQPKRKAKTFTFERENIHAEEKAKQEKETSKKKPGRKGISLFELKPNKEDEDDLFKDLTIQRANPMEASKEVPFEKEESAYESEMRSKFNVEEETEREKEERMMEEIEDIIINNPKISSESEHKWTEEHSYEPVEPVLDFFEEQEEDGFYSEFEPELPEKRGDKSELVIPSLYVDDSAHVIEHHQGFIMPTKNEQEAKEQLIRVGKHEGHRAGAAATHTRTHAKTATSETPVEALKIEVEPVKKEYVYPPINLLSKPKGPSVGTSDRELKETALKLQSTLDSFGVKATITNVSCGPAVTRYELQPEQGVKVSRITNLADDIKLNLAATDIRIEAPIPGKAAVGIEVPNKVNSMVTFRELIESAEFQSCNSDIAFAVGKDISGQTVVTDIGKMPHLLIAGATGSGKSVCINTLIMSVLYKSSPDDIKLIMIDPKVVELNIYNGIPHLLIPVVTDPKKASGALNWAVIEMDKRYDKFAELGVRSLKAYNKKVESIEDNQDERYQKMPQIMIIVDELADLMMVASNDVEAAICRLAQKARAAGIHLVIATQRPSVNVITGLIKANVPSRIAFAVASAIDSRTIIDSSGAEKLLGKGDMLFFPYGYPKPVRIQGAFISDKEVAEVVDFLKEQNDIEPVSAELESKITAVTGTEGQKGKESAYDELFVECGKFIIEKDKASIGMLQRMFKIGYNRAARIVDQLYEAGVVGPDVGTKPRSVLMSMEEFELYVDECV